MFLRSVLYPPPPKTSVIACFIGNFKVNFRKRRKSHCYLFFCRLCKERKKKALGFTVYRNKKNQCKNACIKIAKILSYWPLPVIYIIYYAGYVIFLQCRYLHIPHESINLIFVYRYCKVYNFNIVYCCLLYTFATY